MIFGEQTSGEGCSANVPNSKEFGAFCFGKKVYDWVSPTSSGITAATLHFKKCAILSRHPTPAWRRLMLWPKETYAALPHSSFVPPA